MSEGSPTVRRRRLGLILRSLREKADMTGEEVGSAVERSASWVSRVETGRVGLRGRDLRDLLDLYRVDDAELTHELLGLAREGKQRGWWSKYADTLTGPYATYIGFEADACELLGYEAQVVHGLLQTEEYARALFAGTVPADSSGPLERKVKVRLARQELLSAQKPLRLWAILDESVLLRRIGGKAVMRGQLKRLLQAADLPNVTIQVVPLSAGVNPGMIAAFNLIKFPFEADPDMVYVESATGDVFAEGDGVDWYASAFDHLRSCALTAADSRERIEETVEGLA
jgi:transcriptional regulator with XRE-family HTH domain